MALPCLLLIHERDEVRAQALASTAGASVTLVATADPAHAEHLADVHHPVLVLADIGAARWASSLVGRLRGPGQYLPALALFAPFPAEPQAFQAGAVAFLAPPAGPAEWRALAAMACDGAGLARLTAAVEHAQLGGGTARALDLLRQLIETSSGPVLAWAQYHAAALLLLEGKLQEALEDLSALTDEQPAFWRAHERVATIWEIAGDTAAAGRGHALSRDLRREQALQAERLLEEHPEALVKARQLAGGDDDATSPDLPAVEGGADVVVADDSELVREMLADVLRRAGFRVRLAANGTEALELARQARPDVMILDGLMPGKTGFDACKEVKEEVHPRNPPRVLIFSAIYTKQRQKTEAMTLYKVDEVLAKPAGKPLDEAEILAAVRRHLPR